MPLGNGTVGLIGVFWRLRPARLLLCKGNNSTGSLVKHPHDYNKRRSFLFFLVQRQGRLAPSGPVQTHRSNVATYTSGSGVRSPQGPIRQNLGARPPAPPPDGPQPPAPPLDVTGEFFICQYRLFFTKRKQKNCEIYRIVFPRRDSRYLSSNVDSMRDTPRRPFRILYSQSCQHWFINSIVSPMTMYE